MANGSIVNFTGNLIKEPSTRTVGKNNILVFYVSVLTAKKNENGNGYASDLYEINVWGEKDIQYLNNKLQKGSTVCVSGRMVMNSYKDKEGKDKMIPKVTAFNVDAVANTKDSMKQKKEEDSEELFF